MQPRYRSFLPWVPLAGLVLFLGCNNGGAGVSNGSSLHKGNVAPTAVFTSPAPGTALVRYQPYAFTATATDPDIGDSITKFEWDFGDGTSTVFTTLGSVTHVFNSAGTSDSGTANVQVRAYDSANLAGAYASLNVSVTAADSPITPTFESPAGDLTLQADASGGVVLTYVIRVVSTSSGTIGLSNINFDRGDSQSSLVSSTAVGGGLYNFVVRYNGASSAGTRVASPTVQVSDSNGVSSALVAGPTITINTLSSTNHQPVIVVTNPATPTSSGLTSKPIDLAFTITDPDADAVTYSVDWGDGTPNTTATTSGDTSAGVAVALTHTFPDSFTSTSRTSTILINATDGRTNNGTAQQQTRTFTITYNVYPTATITSPQASATLPSPAALPSNPSIGLVNPPGPNDPDLVVIPSGGKVSFSGVSTPPGSGEAVTYSWTFQGGVPATSTQADPGEVIFTANPGSITPLLATLTVTDAFNRVSSAGPGVNKKTYQKWIIVDGQNTQTFKLAFLYRLKADNNGTSSVAPVTTAGHGLGQIVSIFQDGLTNTYVVQDQSNQALVSVPVRSNLPFYIQIPAFAPENISYLLRIPNAPTGPFSDPSLGTTLLSNTSTFGFENVAPPFNPTLRIVTAQGFAAESLSAPQRKLNGYTDMVLGTLPANERWLDRLSVPADDVTGAIQFSLSNSAVGQLSGISAYQLFAEWPMQLLTRATQDLAETVPDPTAAAGKSTDLGFVLDYPKYQGDTQASETFAAFSMQAFRVPGGGVTDPYQLSPAWQSPTAELNNTRLDPHAGLNPVPVDAAVPTFFNNLINSSPGVTPLAGGIKDFPLPYDPNDPNRIPLIAPTTRGYGGIRQVFSYSEYLWSIVWARPLVLNSARPNFPTTMFALSTFPYFRYSNPAAWPKASAISPDNSAFDLTVHGSGVFDGSAPVSLAPAVPSTTGVGRFFWTAFTPFYDGDASSGAAIARTWLADESTKQPPLTFAGSATGDATVALGFMTPQDTIVDKRGRNANGSLNGSLLGGYRVTWYNPTKDASSNPVPPDFWVVELKDTTGTKHFMLPGNYPATTQNVIDLIMTDARTFLPSGNAPTAGPVLPGDTVAPGYCWFDIPVELRPAPGGVTLTVFAVKSILKNNPVNNPPTVVARALNRPDWLDAIKTATANMKMLTSSGADLSYAYKIPFNFAWDIVVASGPQTLVAP